MRACLYGVAGALVLAATPGRAQIDTPTASARMPLPPVVMGAQIGAGWQVVGLPQQKPPLTRFISEEVGGRWALRMEAQGSYGNLVHEPTAGTKPRQLSWSWRLQTPNPGTDLTNKAGDDLPAKVCLSFDLPLARVPFVERQVMRMARSRSGEHLPAATLCWVWAGATPVEQVLDNPYTRRVRYIVLRNRGDSLQTWFDESRDVAADFKRAFGDESEQMPPLLAVIVGADADNSAGHTVAHVAGLRWAP